MDFNTILFRRSTRGWPTHQLSSIYTDARKMHTNNMTAQDALCVNKKLLILPLRIPLKIENLCACIRWMRFTAYLIFKLMLTIFQFICILLLKKMRVHKEQKP